MIFNFEKVYEHTIPEQPLIWHEFAIYLIQICMFSDSSQVHYCAPQNNPWMEEFLKNKDIYISAFLPLLLVLVLLVCKYVLKTRMEVFTVLAVLRLPDLIIMTWKIRDDVRRLRRRFRGEAV